MALDFETSGLLAYQVARRIDNQIECLKEATMAKYFATDAACRAADHITRIYGAYRFFLEYSAQRYFKDHHFLRGMFRAGGSQMTKQQS